MSLADTGAWRFAVKQRVPFLVHPLRWARYLRAHLRNPGIAWRIERFARGRIAAGPFAGLRFSAMQGDGYSKLLGLYELSLTSALESAIARAPQTVIDVGAADGYYALGLAARLPQARVIAYEMDRSRRPVLRRHARRNGLESRIDLRGLCEANALARDLAGAGFAFVLMDAEGGEAAMLDPARVPGLRQAEILVELHEMFVPGVTGLLRERFAATHRQTLIPMGPSVVPEAQRMIPALEACDPHVLADLLDEHRGAPMEWLHLVPKAAPPDLPEGGAR